MKAKTKNAAGKRNHFKIRLAIRSPILRELRDKQYAGGFLSLLSDPQLVDLSELITKVVMQNEDITICLKRGKRC